jgi:DNA recombination protein RmuC
MFLPTEQAVEKILVADPNFLQKAWTSNIFPVGPSGIMNMLSFARFQITDHRRSENYKAIIEEVRKLLGSISTMADYSQKIGNNLQNMVTNYDKFAGSFNRNFISRVKSIHKLGIDGGNKTLPQVLERYQIVSSKSEIIEVEANDTIEQIEEVK